MPIKPCMRWLVAATAALAVAGSIIIAAPAASADSGISGIGPIHRQISIATGYGLKVNGHWFGSYLNGGRIMYCVSPNKKLTVGQSVSTIASWSHIGTEKSEEVAYILSKYGNTHSKVQAAAVYDAINQIVGNDAKQFNAWEHRAPASVRAAARTAVRNAKLYHGPYKVGISITRQALVGQAGTAEVTVKSATGRGVASKVELSARNASISGSVKTNSHGVASVSFTRTGTGTVKIYARGIGMPSTSVVLSTPAKGQQELMSFAPSVNSGWASASYQKSSSGSVQYNCTTTCNGKPPVTYTWCHAAYEATRKYQVLDNGKVVKTAEIKRSSKSSCVTATAIIPDTHKASAACSYYVGGKWQTAVSCGPTVVVDCPPWPVVTETLSCDCTVGYVVLSLPKNATTHVEAINYSVNGGENFQPTAVPGKTLAVKIPFDRSKGDTDVVFSAGVQRANGAWNGGGTQEVIVRKVN